MEWPARSALWIIATGVVAAFLYLLREALTPFALALILWLAIDGLAEALDRRIPYTPRPRPRTLSIPRARARIAATSGV